MRQGRQQTFPGSGNPRQVTYRRRTPTYTPLYRVVYQERDNLECKWEECFQPKYGALRGEVLKTLDAFLKNAPLSFFEAVRFALATH